MQANDIINGLFEIMSAAFCTINIFKILKDKKIMGISWVPTFFYTIWGMWNLYYYPSLNQMVSFFGGVGIFVVNITWLILVFYYKHQDNKKKIKEDGKDKPWNFKTN